MGWFVYDDTNGVTALRYTTKLTKTELNYAYRIVYTYKSRFWGNQTYTVEGFVDEMESAKYFSGVKSTATLNKSFIVSSTPYEKNFRQKIDWNYDSMTNNAAGPPQASVTINGTAKENVYFMQAAVGSTNTVDDTVRAEFFLPYKYNEETKSETGLDLYNAEGTKLEGTEIAFDDRHYESSTVKSQAGHLFNYDSSIPDIPTSGQTTDDFPKLVKAAPYVLKKGVWNTEDSKWIFTNLSGDDFHYADTYTTKEYDGNMSFEIGGTYYYATETAPEDIPKGYQLLGEDDGMFFGKSKKAGLTTTEPPQHILSPKKTATMFITSTLRKMSAWVTRFLPRAMLSTALFRTAMLK